MLEPARDTQTCYSKVVESCTRRRYDGKSCEAGLKPDQTRGSLITQPSIQNSSDGLRFSTYVVLFTNAIGHCSLHQTEVQHVCSTNVNNPETTLSTALEPIRQLMQTYTC